MLNFDLLFPIQLILLILGSAFFSGSEVAIFSLDKKKLGSYFVNKGLIYRYLSALLEAPKRLLIAILIGNTLVNVIASFICAVYALKIAEQYHFSTNLIISVEIIVLTLVLLIFGEITPKVLSSKSPVLIAKVTAIPLYWINVLLYPIAQSCNELIRVLLSRLHFSGTSHILANDEIPHMVQLGHESGTLEDEEHDLIQGLVSSKTTRVKEIMTHRMEIIAVSVDQTFQELVETVKESAHSRLPVYHENLDEIIGVLYAKDLLVYMNHHEALSDFSIGKLVRNPLIVPETKLINELMKDFQEKKMHLAIVVDEYGGTSGLVTLEDIIEEIIGDIRDDNDVEGETIKHLPDGSYAIDGSVPIDELIEELVLNIDIEDATYETAAGWVLSKIGRIPKAGDSFIFQKYKFSIREVKSNKITLFNAEKMK